MSLVVQVVVMVVVHVADLCYHIEGSHSGVACVCVDVCTYVRVCVCVCVLSPFLTK
jgi:hypothetical protein